MQAPMKITYVAIFDASINPLQDHSENKLKTQITRSLICPLSMLHLKIHNLIYHSRDILAEWGSLFACIISHPSILFALT